MQDKNIPANVPSKADLGLRHLIVKSAECCPRQTRQVQASIPKFDENSPGEPGVSTIDDELAVMLLACNAFAAVSREALDVSDLACPQ